MKYQITWKQLNKQDGSKTYIQNLQYLARTMVYSFAILVGLFLIATILLYLANDYQLLKLIQ